jgi:RHS repeat-associated protein
VDSAGALYFAESYARKPQFGNWIFRHHSLVRRIEPTGTVKTLAGVVADWNVADTPSECWQGPVCLPRAIEIDEQPEGTYVYFTTYNTAPGGSSNQRIRRLRPGPGPDQSIEYVMSPNGEVLTAPVDLLMLGPSAILAAELNHRVRMVTFVEDAQGFVVPESTTIAAFAGTGEEFAGPLQEGYADEVAIGQSKGLARGPNGEVFVAATAACKTHVVMLIPAEGMPGKWHLRHVAGQTALDCGGGNAPPELNEGAEVKDVALWELAGLVWLPREDSLVLVNRSWNSLWTMPGEFEYPTLKYSSLTATGAGGWVLAENVGTKHYFNGSGRHTKSVDRWGRTTRYKYGQTGLLQRIELPFGRAYLFGYDAQNRLQSIDRGTCAGEVCTPEGNAASFTIDAQGNLVAAALPDAAVRQFEYDEDHLIVRRYHGEATPSPERFVEYQYNMGMVDEVWFHDPNLPGNPIRNRKYVHGRQLGLAGVEPEPIVQPANAGWDAVTDAGGRTTWTLFDTKGRTLRVEDSTGRRVLFRRDAGGQITEVCQFSVPGVDDCAEADYRETYSYDEQGNLTTKRIHDQEAADPDLSFSQWTYGFAVDTNALENPDSGQNEDFEFTVMSTILNPENQLVMLDHDDFGNLTELHLVKGWHLDDQNNIVVDSEDVGTWVYSNPASGLPTLSYDPSCVHQAQPDLCRILFQYDGNENLVSTTVGDGSYVGYTRDGLTGRVVGTYAPVVVGEAGSATSSAWSLQRDVWGQITQAVGPAMGPWSMEYTDPLTAAGCASCSGGTKIARAVGPGESASTVSKHSYDLAGRLARTQLGYSVDGQADVLPYGVSYEHDAVGRLTAAETEGTDSALTFAYDAAGRLDAVTIADSAESSVAWGYDADVFGRVSAVQAPDGGQWTYAYDHLSNMAGVAETQSGRTTLFDRDKVGRMTRRLIGTGVPNDPRWSYLYDAIGRLLKVQDPTETPDNPNDSNGTTFERDELGRVVQVKRDGTVVDSSARDAHRRLDWVKRLDGNVEFKYDVSYDLAGNPAWLEGVWREGSPLAETGAFKHRYLYNSARGISGVKAWLKKAGQWSPTPVLTLAYSFDAAGRISGLSLNEGTHKVELHRDAMGRVARLDFLGPGGPPSPVVKVRTLLTYDDASMWLSTVRTGSPDGGDDLLDTSVLDLGYFYDAAGRITRLEEGDFFGREFTYDDVSRLIGTVDLYSNPPGPTVELRSFAYTYNTAGERLTQVAFGATETYSWDSHGVLTSISGSGTDRTFAFDLAGNLTSITPSAGPAMTFAYDLSGRTKQVTAPNGNVVTYRYGPDERRVLKSVDADGNGIPEATTRYFNDGLVAYEINGLTGDLQRAFVFMPDGFTPVMLVTFVGNAAAEVFFFHNDHLSTPRALTDESGAVVWRARYEPFGGVGTSPNPNLAAGDIGIDADADDDGVALDQPLRFPGQWDDAVPGVWYNWHRFYLPALGMYATRDPLPLWPFRVDAGQTPHFAYVNSRPGVGRDPTGLDMYVCQRTWGHAIPVWGETCLGSWCPQHVYAMFTDPDNETDETKWEYYGVGGTEDPEVVSPEGTKKTENPRSSGTMCWWIKGSGEIQDKLKDAVVNSIIATEAEGWDYGDSDCHSALQDALEEVGLDVPPTERIKWVE